MIEFEDEETIEASEVEDVIEDAEEVSEDIYEEDLEEEVDQEELEEDSEEESEEDDEEEISEEELDHVADVAIETLRDILAYFGAEDASIDEYEGDEGEILLDVVGNDYAILIGRHGRTLDSIQFLVTSILYKKLGFRYPVVIDVEGYKYRRRQKIESIAHKAAGRAIKQGKPVSLRPMTPYERRIVHIALREDSRVSTVSEGTEPNRHVIIQPMKF